jgi:hypothetical protein
MVTSSLQNIHGTAVKEGGAEEGRRFSSRLYPFLWWASGQSPYY